VPTNNGNFDDLPTGPCDFTSVNAFAGPYHGMTFSGGGSILAYANPTVPCDSGFGLTGGTTPNFLAFNNTGTGVHQDGSRATLPETITFTGTVHNVSISAGSSSGAQLTLTAFSGPNGTGTNLGATNVAALGTAMQTVSVSSGTGIGSVVISTTSSAYLVGIDNIVTS